jgi:hypothetical protein
MLRSVDLKLVVCGTELTVLQEEIPSAIPVELCCLGWQESPNMLARVIEPEIPDGA